MILKEESTQIGYIQKPHGVKGELVLTLSEGIYSDDLDPEFIFLDIDNGLVPFYVETYRIKSTKSILIKLETIDNESKAKLITGSQTYIETSLLEQSDDLPLKAFVGFKVTDIQKGYIGTITDVHEFSNNPLFVIDHEGNEVLIPINQSFIQSYNDINKSMNVNLPEGLIDLNLKKVVENINVY